MNRIYSAFDTIKTEETLKTHTMAFLQEKAFNKKKVAFKRFALAIASVLVVLFAGLLSYTAYFTETAFIDIDVNPSMELTLNRFQRVIAVYAYNEAGMEVLENANVLHKTYEEALAILIDEMEGLGYIKKAELFTATLQMVDSENESVQLDALKACIALDLQAEGKFTEPEVFSVDSVIKVQAQEQNLSPAKYLAILELQEVDSTATFDGCRGHSINEIRQETHSHANGTHGNGGQGSMHGGNAANGNGHHEASGNVEDAESAVESAYNGDDKNDMVSAQTEENEMENCNPQKNQQQNGGMHNGGKRRGGRHT